MYAEADTHKSAQWSEKFNGPPMTLTWSRFITRQPPENLENLYMRCMRRGTDKVLDQLTISVEPLHWLGRDCAGSLLPGVYGDSIQSRSSSLFRPYSGSGTSLNPRYGGKTCVARRTHIYERVKDRSKSMTKTELMSRKYISSSTHFRTLIEDDNKLALCVFAEFDRESDVRLVHLFETITIICFGSFDWEIPTGIFAPTSTWNLLEDNDDALAAAGVPLQLPWTDHSGLNHALPIRQICHRRIDSSTAICMYCRNTDKKRKDDGRPPIEWHVLPPDLDRPAATAAFACKQCYVSAMQSGAKYGEIGLNLVYHKCEVCSRVTADVCTPKPIPAELTERLQEGRLCGDCSKIIRSYGVDPPE